MYLRDIKKNTLGVRLLAYHRNEQSTSPLLDSSHQNGCRYLLIETSQENFTPQLRGIVASPQSSTTSTTRPPALVFRLRIVPSQSLMVFRNFTTISMVRSKFTLHITSYTTCQSYIRCYFFFPIRTFYYVSQLIFYILHEAPTLGNYPLLSLSSSSLS